MRELIERQAAVDALMEAVKSVGVLDADDIKTVFDMLPSVQHEKEQLSKEGATKDTISRQAALEKVRAMQTYKLFMGDDMILVDKAEVQTELMMLPPAQPEPQWIPVSERLPSKEERKEWIDNNLDGIGYLYPCLVTRYSSINPDRTKNNPYVAKHYFDGEDFLNAGEEVCSEYIIAWMPLPKPFEGEGEQE